VFGGLSNAICRCLKKLSSVFFLAKKADAIERELDSWQHGFLE